MLAVLALSSTAPAVAENKAYPDKFRLAFSGYSIDRSNATLSVTDPDLGIGVAINPRDAFGLDFDSTVLRIEGYYRFNERHALTYGWYNLDSTGSKSLEDSVDWVDRDGNEISIPVGATVESTLDVETIKVGYLYSFYESEKVEAAIGAGFHISRLEVGLDASVITPPNASIQQVDTSVPLPVVSGAFRYYVTPRFQWDLRAEIFSLEFDDWYGSFIDVTFGLEYRVWKHVALGAALTRSALEIEEDNKDYFLQYENQLNGALIYVATYF